MAAMPLARIARQLAAQGNIKISNSGMNLAGHNSPASPDIRPICITKHSPRWFKVMTPMRRTPSLESELALKGKLRKVTLPDARPRQRFSSQSDALW
jgi:hypothetical protein